MRDADALTERDERILRYLSEHGFASARWIRDAFWPGQSNCHHYRRLSKLRVLGWVEYLVGDGGHRLGYRLTRKGVDLLRRSGAQDVDLKEIRTAYRTTFDHDNAMLGVGNVLRAFPAVSDYLSEPRVRSLLARRHGHKERRSDGYKVPDALLRLKTQKGTYQVAVELEYSLKARAYCERVLRQLVLSQDFSLVFLVVKDAKMLRRYQSVLKHVRANDPRIRFAQRDNGIYFCVLADLLRERGQSKLIGEGTEFELAALASAPSRQGGIREDQSASDRGTSDSRLSS